MKKLAGHAAWAVEARFAELVSDRTLAWWWARGRHERVFEVFEQRAWSEGAPLLAAYGRFFEPNANEEISLARAERLTALGDDAVLRKTRLALGHVEPDESELLGTFHGLPLGSLLAVVATKTPGTEIVVEGVPRPDLVPQLLARVAQADEQYREGLITLDERAAPELALAIARGTGEALVAADLRDALELAARPASFPEFSARHRRRLEKLASGSPHRFERWLMRRVPEPVEARAIADAHPELVAQLSNRAAAFLALLPGESERLARELSHDRTAGWHVRACHVLAGLLRDGVSTRGVASTVLGVPHGTIEPALVTHLVRAVKQADPVFYGEIQGRVAHALDSLGRRVRSWK